MTPKLKTAYKYKGNKRKILLNLYYQKHSREAKLYRKYKSRLFLGLLEMWNDFHILPTPLLKASQLIGDEIKYTKDSFTYMVPYKTTK